MKKLIVLALAALLSSTAALAEDAPAPEAPAKGAKAKKPAKKVDDRTPFEKQLGKSLKKLKLEGEAKTKSAQAITAHHEREVELFTQVKKTAKSKDPLVVATALRDYHSLQVETLEALQTALGEEDWQRMVGGKKGKKGKKKVATTE